MSKFKAGDLVEMRIDDKSSHRTKWNGLRCRVIDVINDSLSVDPLTTRPDGCGFNQFQWVAKDFVKVNDPEYVNLTPKKEWDLTRMDNLCDAIAYRMENEFDVPQEWFTELIELVLRGRSR